MFPHHQLMVTNWEHLITFFFIAKLPVWLRQLYLFGQKYHHYWFIDFGDSLFFTAVATIWCPYLARHHINITLYILGLYIGISLRLCPWEIPLSSPESPQETPSIPPLLLKWKSPIGDKITNWWFELRIDVFRIGDWGFRIEDWGKMNMGKTPIPN